MFGISQSARVFSSASSTLHDDSATGSKMLDGEILCSDTAAFVLSFLTGGFSGGDVGLQHRCFEELKACTHSLITRQRTRGRSRQPMSFMPSSLTWCRSGFPHIAIRLEFWARPSQPTSISRACLPCLALSWVAVTKIRDSACRIPFNFNLVERSYAHGWARHASDKDQATVCRWAIERTHTRSERDIDRDRHTHTHTPLPSNKLVFRECLSLGFIGPTFKSDSFHAV